MRRVEGLRRTAVVPVVTVSVLEHCGKVIAGEKLA